MSGELDPLVAALRSAGEAGKQEITRLATVVTGTATTISVVFDGESSMSARPYPKLYAPASVGDRVIMLRTGSTWAAIGRVPGPSPDTGPVSVSLAAGWSAGSVQYRRVNGIVYLYVGVVWNGFVGSWAQGQLIATLPVGARPSTAPVYQVGVDAGSALGFRGWAVGTDGAVLAQAAANNSIYGWVAYPGDV